MSPPSEKASHASSTDTSSSSCGCRRCNVTSGGRLAAVVSCVVPVCVLVCLCFSCWTYVRIVELQTELSKCRCVGPEETWREQQVFSDGKTASERQTGQSSLGATPTGLLYSTDEYEEDIYPNMVSDVHDYRSSNSSVNHLTPRMHRRDAGTESGSRRRRCRRKGRRQKAQPHVHYETAEYSIVNVAGTVRLWQPSDWFAPEGCWFVLKNGQVRVKEAGVYWIYAQVTFEAGKDAAARSRVLLGGRGDRPPTPILTCAGPGQGEAGRGTRACFVAGIKRLDRNDRISVEAWGDVKASPDYTYFGLLKLGI